MGFVKRLTNLSYVTEPPKPSYGETLYNPETVRYYKIFHGDAVHILLKFMPKSVHSCFASPYILESDSPVWEDFYGHRSQLFKLLYETIKNDGSLFLKLSTKDNNDGSKQLFELMEGVGWIKHCDSEYSNDMYVGHWTKSDDFYVNPDHDSNKPPILLEDFELFKTLINKNRKRKYNIDMNENVNPMLGETDKIIDKICSKHTPPDGVTLDPTAGYGRFIITALQRQRRVIGIEQMKGRSLVCVKRSQIFLDNIVC